MLFILRTEQVLSAVNMTIGQLDLLLAIPKHGSLSWQDQCIDFYAIVSLSSLVPKVLQLLSLRVGWLVFETAFFCCEWMKFQVSWMLLDIDWPCFPIPPPCLSIIISRSLSYWSGSMQQSCMQHHICHNGQDAAGANAHHASSDGISTTKSEVYNSVRAWQSI